MYPATPPNAKRAGIRLVKCKGDIVGISPPHILQDVAWQVEGYDPHLKTCLKPLFVLLLFLKRNKRNKAFIKSPRKGSEVKGLVGELYQVIILGEVQSTLLGVSTPVPIMREDLTIVQDNIFYPPSRMRMLSIIAVSSSLRKHGGARQQSVQDHAKRCTEHNMLENSMPAMQRCP